MKDERNRAIGHLLESFREIPDPRVDRCKVHSLEVLLFIALCTFLVGGQSFYEMETFARNRLQWLKDVAGMKSVPSHDTFNRVFQALCPEDFGGFLVSITARLREKVSGDIVAFDGKCHRRTSGATQTALHMMNVWSVGNQLVLGQLAVDEKSNEITAMPKLMDVVDLKGCIVTADAMNCQKAIAAKAVKCGADYVLALKGNQGLAYDEIKLFMDNLAEGEKCDFMTQKKSHGRLETRKYWQSTEIEWFADKQLWAGLKSFCMVESTREVSGERQVSRRYYISSVAGDIGQISGAIRSHWEIENCLHWRLDVVMNEDQSRARTRNAAKNLGTLRALCLNLIKQIPGKMSLRCKRLQAALDYESLLMALKI